MVGLDLGIEMIRAIFTYADFEEIHILSALGNSDTTELDDLEQLIESYVDDFEEAEGLEIAKEYGKLYLFNEYDADIHELVEFEKFTTHSRDFSHELVVTYVIHIFILNTVKYLHY